MKQKSYHNIKIYKIRLLPFITKMTTIVFVLSSKPNNFSIQFEFTDTNNEQILVLVINLSQLIMLEFVV